VPDHILLKRGALSPDEVDLIAQHERIGVELIERSFRSEALTEILKCRSTPFNGYEKRSGLPIGREIPLGARLLAICDSYDSMTNDHVYRKSMSHDAAIEELRKHAGSQFDPELVEYFARVIDSQPELSPESSKEVSVSIGLQVQLLIEAINEKDTAGVRMLASRLMLYARRCQADTVAVSAGDIHLRSNDDVIPWQVMLRSTQELMELCNEFTRQPELLARDVELRNSDESLATEAPPAGGEAVQGTVAKTGFSLMQGIPVPTEGEHWSYFPDR
ncbi:MAG: HD domain-containing phosphohydrolase, partial [Planctomycetota bacterium]